MHIQDAGRWLPTAHSLHRAVKLVGAARKWLLPPQPHALHLAVEPTPDGVTTGRLPNQREVSLAYTGVVHVRVGARATRIDAAGMSQADLLEQIVAVLAHGDPALQPDAHGRYAPALLNAARPDGSPLFKDHEGLTSGETFTIDRNLAAAYAALQEAAFMGLARFKARLSGGMTPLVVWEHHFDLSTLWFATDVQDEHAPHLNFGFAPFSDGIDLPYLYAYGYPLRPLTDTPALPAPALWHTTGWTGALIQTADIAAANNPVYFVESICRDLFAALLPLVETST